MSSSVFVLKYDVTAVYVVTIYIVHSMQIFLGWDTGCTTLSLNVIDFNFTFPVWWMNEIKDHFSIIWSDKMSLILQSYCIFGMIWAEWGHMTTMCCSISLFEIVYFICCIHHEWFLVNLFCFAWSIQLQRRHEQMKKNLEAQHKELEEKRRQLEEEKVSWEAQQRMLEQQKLDASRYTHFYKTSELH